MIEPTFDDVGRRVIYTGNRYPGGQLEHGVITGLTAHGVFVRYGAERQPKSTSPEDLEWNDAGHSDRRADHRAG